MIQQASHCASFDIDAQNCFTPVCPEELPVPEGDRIVNELNHQARYAYYRIGSKDAHPRNAAWVADDQHPPLSPVEGHNMDVRWPVHAVPGTEGFELIEGLPHPAQYDFFTWTGVEPDMHPYGKCYHDLKGRLSTGLIEYLQARQVNLVLAGGLATDYCVKTTVLQLLQAGFQVVVNLGACRGLAADTTDRAIAAMREAGARFVQCASELDALEIEPPG
jgi:nicotinamidase/pyrazinamidase